MRLLFVCRSAKGKHMIHAQRFLALMCAAAVTASVVGCRTHRCHHCQHHAQHYPAVESYEIYSAPEIQEVGQPQPLERIETAAPVGPAPAAIDPVPAKPQPSPAKKAEFPPAPKEDKNAASLELPVLPNVGSEKDVLSFEEFLQRKRG